jgi:hypothetical protein
VENNLDEEEQLQENVETQQDAVNDYVEDNSPSEVEKDSLYSLFWKVINKTDSSKIGNLDKQELGMLDMSVRDLQRIAKICQIVGYKKVESWLKDQAEIILATSVSKKALLLELFVTAKKYSSKEKRMGVPEGITMATSEPEKKSFWSRFKK